MEKQNAKTKNKQLKEQRTKREEGATNIMNYNKQKACNGCEK